MKVKVIKGYLSHKRKLFGVGSVLDLDEAQVRRLIDAGVVAAAGEEVPAAAPAPEAEEETGGGDELPAADPVAAVKKGRKKK